MNIAWEEHEARLNEGDMSHRSVKNVILWALGQVCVELPNDFTHRTNIFFMMLLIEQGVDYTTAMISFSIIVLILSIIGASFNFILVCISVRYAIKKQMVVGISVFIIALNLIALWSYHLAGFAILLFFLSFLPQAAQAIHGSQVPFIATTDLHNFSDRMSILMSWITHNLYLAVTRMFPSWQYYQANTQALMGMAQAPPKPMGTIWISTGVCVFAILTAIPYLFLDEHKNKPPISNFKYNMVYIANEFKTIISDMIREKNFLFFLICIIGLQYCPIYCSVLFHTIQTDILHASSFEIELRENIFFWIYFIAFLAVPKMTAKRGPKFMVMVLLFATMMACSYQMLSVHAPLLQYPCTIMCGLVNASVNVCIRRFIYENATYDTISMHYGVVTIISKIMSSIGVVISLIYSIQEDLNFYVRFYAVSFIFFVLAAIGMICGIFTRDHHTQYTLGLRPPYLKYEILEEKD